MAYIDFSEPGRVLPGQDTRSAPKGFIKSAARASEFSPLEWHVVSLARHDRISSIQSPGRVTRALRWLFGLTTSNTLSNPRLEALRRMAVLSWHRGYSVPEDEVRGFIAAGFALDHYDILLTHINAMRAATR